MKIQKIMMAFTVAVIFYSCSTVPLTGRKQFLPVGDAEINQSAATSYRQLLSDPKTKVITGTSDAQKIKNVGNRLAAAIQTYLTQNGYGDQYNFQWEFNLIQSPEVNAWCMPGGKVAVYSGILPITLNDAGLATVMGHEIGHAIAKHSAERIGHEYLAQGVGAAVGVAAATSQSKLAGTISQLYNPASQVVLLHYSRSQETEADRLGLTFMAMAGYDPNSAVAFWQRMSAKSGGNAPPEFLSTHPSDASRIREIQNRIPEAMKYYKK